MKLNGQEAEKIGQFLRALDEATHATGCSVEAGTLWLDGALVGDLREKQDETWVGHYFIESSQ